jgi:hypothetical protein
MTFSSFQKAETKYWSIIQMTAQLGLSLESFRMVHNYFSLHEWSGSLQIIERGSGSLLRNSNNSATYEEER